MDKPKSARELMYEALKLQNEKQRELEMLEERARSRRAELAQIEEKCATLRHQIGVHDVEVSRYAAELKK